MLLYATLQTDMDIMDSTVPPPADPARMHVFLSYSRVNSDLVNRIVTDLKAQQINVWLDQTNLKPGTQNWENALRIAVRDSFAVVLVATPNSRESDYVYAEVELADLYNRPIMPVWSVGDAWIDSVPMRFSRTQYIDVRDAQYDEGLRELTAWLREQWEIPPKEQSSVSVEAVAPLTNPYKALDAFTENDANCFFGRADQIDDLVNALKTSHFLPVIGASGAGKSSLIMAGLIPELKRGALPGSDHWLYLPVVRPGKTPLENLAVAVAGEAADLEGILRLFDGRRGLVQAAKKLTAGTDRRVVVYIDQFEEVYLQTTDEDERRAFLALLETAVGDPDGRIVLILTLRADFYDRPLTMPRGEAFAQQLRQHQRTIIPMNAQELRAAIEEPVRLIGLRLEPGLTGFQR